MGAWDTDPFGNDDACDWAFILEETEGLSLIETTFKRVEENGEAYLDASEATTAIAAADTLARLRGNFYDRNSYTEPVDQWVSAHPMTPTPDLLSRAIKVLDRVLKQPSELIELWEEAGELDSWKDHVEKLKERLK